MTTAPVIKTERLILRGMILADYAPTRAFFDTDRAKFVGAPISDARLWMGFASDVGAWELLGMGAWSVTLLDGTLIGQIGINQPKHFPEVEMGWILFEGFEGQGYAFEAACAARDWALEKLHLESLVSYIDSKNTTSINLAKKLGAALDTTAATPDNDPCLVYRYEVAIADADGSQEAYA